MTETNGQDNLLQQLVRQCQRDSVRWFPTVSKDEAADGNITRELVHHVLSLCGEAGELANKIKKLDRGTESLDDELFAFDVRDELTDTFIYLLNVAALLKMDLLKEYLRKRDFNEKRFGMKV